MEESDLAKQITVSLEDKEKEQLLKFFQKLDKQTLKATAEAISMMVRAFEGKPIEPDDIITRLTNVKNILERSRFPTYPLLAKQVYLRLIAKYNPQAYACKDWANLEAEALIEYRGQGRQEYVDSIKAASNIASEQQFYLGPQKAPESQIKRHLWQRKPKTEESEFENQ